MTRAPNQRSRSGPLLYADLQVRSGPPMDSPLSLADRHQINGLIQRYGGQVQDPASRRLSASFLRHQDALACAHDLRAMICRIGLEKPAQSGLNCRILLAHGLISEPGSYQEAQIAMGLSMQLAQVPPDSIVGVQAFLDHLTLRPPVVPYGHSSVGRKNSTLYLFAAAGFAITEEEKTSEMSVVSALAGSLYSELTLRTPEQSRVLHPIDCPVTLGRGGACGFMVKSPDASRIHGRILYANEKFHYADTSRNGTFVLLHGGNELRLLKESLVLVGEGVISLGAPVSRQRGELVSFLCNPVQLGAEAPVRQSLR